MSGSDVDLDIALEPTTPADAITLLGIGDVAAAFLVQGFLATSAMATTIAAAMLR